MWTCLARKRVHLLRLVALIAVAQHATAQVNGSMPQMSATAPNGQEALLKWALANSNPDELRQAAADARAAAHAGSADFRERQARVQQLIDAMRSEPSEAELMAEAIAILRNISASQQQLSNAMDALRYLVEPIDAANNLHDMGGVAPVVALLAAQHPPEVQARAAHLLGTAAANNQDFLAQLLQHHPEVLSRLLMLVESSVAESRAGRSNAGEGAGNNSGGSGALSASDVRSRSRHGEGSGGTGGPSSEAMEASVKALYCLSAVLRLSREARRAFHEAPQGASTLQLLLRAPGLDPRLKRKTLGLLTDLVHLSDEDGQYQQQREMQTQQQQQALGVARLDYPAAAAAALELLQQEIDAGDKADPDMQEKALLTLLALLDSRGGAAAGQQLATEQGRTVLAQVQAGLQAAARVQQDDYLAELSQLAFKVHSRTSSAAPALGHDDSEL